MFYRLMLLLAVQTFVVSFAAEAKTYATYNKVTYATDGDVELGEWTSQYTKAREYAEARHVPIIVYWGNKGCSICQTIENKLGTDKNFLEWQEENGIVMVYVINNVTGSEAKLAKNALGSGDYPIVGYYWLKPGETPRKFDHVFMGSVNNQPAKIMTYAQQYFAGYHIGFDHDYPENLAVEYGLCKKSHYFLRGGTNWFHIARKANVKYAVRLLTTAQARSKFQFSLISEDACGNPLESDLGLGYEFFGDADGNTLFGVESVQVNNEGGAYVPVEFDLQFVAMDPGLSTCFPDVSMRFKALGQEDWRECDCNGWNIVPNGADVSGDATIGKVLWAEEDRALTDPEDLLDEKVQVTSRKSVWMQAVAPNGVRSEKVCASFALGECAAPTCSYEPVSGDYGPQRVTLATTTPGALICYTLDGSEVTEGSPIYSGSFVVQESTEGCAKVFKENWVDSKVVAFAIDDGRQDIGGVDIEWGDCYMDGGHLKIGLSLRNGENVRLTADDFWASFGVIDEEDPMLVVYIQGLNRYKGGRVEQTPLPSGNFAEVDGQVWFYRENGETIEIASGPKFVKKLFVPSEIKGLPVTAIGADAFSGARVVEVILPVGLMSIGANAFAECSLLERVYFRGNAPLADGFIYSSTPETLVSYVGEGTTGWDEGSANLPALWQDRAIAYGMTPVVIDGVEWRYAVKNEKVKLTAVQAVLADEIVSGNVTIPSEIDGMKVVEISDNAFAGLDKITSVTIPASVRTIGSKAFYGCDGLESVTFLGDAPYVYDDAFSGTKSTLAFSVPQGSIGWSDTSLTGLPGAWKGHAIQYAGGGQRPEQPSANLGTVTVSNIVVHYVLNSVQPQFAISPSQDMGFVNIITEVKSTGVAAIPMSWAMNYPNFVSKFGSDFTAALGKPTGKIGTGGTPMLVWQDYVAGTDPTNEKDVFTASITIVDGKVTISYTPELDDARKAMRKYTTWGKTSLMDTDWTEVQDGHESEYNFFKVSVEMR